MKDRKLYFKICFPLLNLLYARQCIFLDITYILLTVSTKTSSMRKVFALLLSLSTYISLVCPWVLNTFYLFLKTH